MIRYFLLVLFPIWSIAQPYPGPAGQPGTSAIHKDSAVFVAWAISADVERGLQDLSNPSLGYASVGEASLACGKALSNGVVSLGDGGKATCSFEYPVKNGPGFDFAVFENSIDDTFLELAFVEVSSDGINFFRFPSHSLTDTVNQTPGFGSTDATKLNNLAGKYRVGFGTPFDLQELAGTVGLDINAITKIRIVDVVGSLNSAYATRDSYQNKVNDPWPTPFPSSGFDLDAIGIIHQDAIVSVKEQIKEEILIHPQPVHAYGQLKISSSIRVNKITITDMAGREIYSENPETGTIMVPGLSAGIYLLRMESVEEVRLSKLFVE